MAIRHLWNLLREAFERIGPRRTCSSVCANVFWLGVIWTRLVYRSPTLQRFVSAGLILGALCGYVLAPRWWSGRSERKRKRTSMVLFLVFLLCFVATAFVSWCLKPDAATQFPWVECVFKVLTAGGLANWVLFLLWGALAWCLTTAIVIGSPELKHKRDKQPTDT